ncbi:MAG: hypothetical protein J07HX64_02891 [halophilic archaeon J07HX64]|nr:MAG: hypothetical protein J07HX64_02891 [halophilic archaeon J07HX64]
MSDVNTVTLDDNNISDTPFPGLFVEFADDVTTRGNDISVDGNGINVQNSVNVTIAENSISGTNFAGIFVDSVANLSVLSNDVQNAQDNFNDPSGMDITRGSHPHRTPSTTETRQSAAAPHSLVVAVPRTAGTVTPARVPTTASRRLPPPVQT